MLVDARGTIRAVEFSPHHFGLKLVGQSFVTVKDLLKLLQGNCLF